MLFEMLLNAIPDYSTFQATLTSIESTLNPVAAAVVTDMTDVATL